MDRRSFVVAAAAFIAGCGGTTDEGNEPTSRTETTDTPTFTTPSASPSPTPRAEAVEAAIEESRRQLAGALGAIEAAEVVEDGGPGIYSEDGSPGYSEGLSAAEERTVAARERLEAVSSDAAGEQAATVERLLRLSLYLRAKRFVHRGLLNAFIDYELGVGSLQQRPGEAAETLQQGAERFGRANELRARARARLEEVGETEGSIAVDGFELPTERDGLRAAGRIVGRFRPSAAGFATFGLTLRSLSRAEERHRDDGDYEAARSAFQAAVSSAAEGASSLRTAARRGIATGAEHREFACRLSELEGGARAGADAMGAFAAGNESRGEDLYQQYRSAIENVTDTCAEAAEGD